MHDWLSSSYTYSTRKWLIAIRNDSLPWRLPHTDRNLWQHVLLWSRSLICVYSYDIMVSLFIKKREVLWCLGQWSCCQQLVSPTDMPTQTPHCSTLSSRQHSWHTKVPPYSKVIRSSWPTRWTLGLLASIADATMDTILGWWYHILGTRQPIMWWRGRSCPSIQNGNENYFILQELGLWHHKMMSFGMKSHYSTVFQIHSHIFLPRICSIFLHMDAFPV